MSEVNIAADLLHTRTHRLYILLLALRGRAIEVGGNMFRLRLELASKCFFGQSLCRLKLCDLCHLYTEYMASRDIFACRICFSVDPLHCL